MRRDGLSLRTCWGARDADPNDNFWDFTLGNDADTSVVPERVAPGIDFTKTAITSNFQSIGDNVDYTLSVQNIGTVFIDNISITDDQIANVTCPQSRLDPGGACVLTGTLIVSQGPVDTGEIENTGSVTSDLIPAAQTDTVNTPIPQISALGFYKRKLTWSYNAVGDALSYEYDVTNLGNVTITSPITVSDDQIASVSCRALPAGGLAPNGVVTCTATASTTQENIDEGSVTNIASATDGTTSSPSDAVTINAVQSSGLRLTKTATPQTFAAVGDTVTYEYIVTNTGNTTIVDAITVSDDRILGVTCPALPVGGLLPTGSITCYATYSVTQVDLDAGSLTIQATGDTY